jgi:hypothetical protein
MNPSISLLAPRINLVRQSQLKCDLRPKVRPLVWQRWAQYLCWSGGWHQTETREVTAGGGSSPVRLLLIFPGKSPHLRALDSSYTGSNVLIIWYKISHIITGSNVFIFWYMTPCSLPLWRVHEIKRM